VQAVGSRRRPGHLGQGDHIGSGAGVDGLGVTQTPVGLLANGPEGLPVLRSDAPADPMSRVSPIAVSVRNAQCCLKYCLIRLAL
jgi:hypothetical protein